MLVLVLVPEVDVDVDGVVVAAEVVLLFPVGVYALVSTMIVPVFYG